MALARGTLPLRACHHLNKLHYKLHYKLYSKLTVQGDQHGVAQEHGEANGDGGQAVGGGGGVLVDGGEVHHVALRGGGGWWWCVCGGGGGVEDGRGAGMVGGRQERVH